MSNPCYSTYIFEGPSKEIRSLGKRLCRVFAKQAKEVDEKEAYDLEFERQHFIGIIEALDMPSVIDYRGAVRGRITPKSYRSLGDGRETLTFNTESAYVPANDIWDYAIRRWAPHCRYYFYGEELWIEGAMTNDWDRKYFPWDYVIEVDISDKTQEPFKSLFLDGAAYCKKRTAHHGYMAYWSQKALRKVLLRLIPQPNWKTADLLHMTEEDINRASAGIQLAIHVHRVRTV